MANGKGAAGIKLGGWTGGFAVSRLPFHVLRVYDL
jgi:hypothetical protein